MSTHAKFTFSPRGNYIDGRFVQASEMPKGANGEWISRAPGDLSDELGRIEYSYGAVDVAVAAARDALPAWRRLRISERAALLKSYQAGIKKREDELAELIAREVGKPVWESKTEVATMFNKVDVTINESPKLVADIDLPKIMPDTQGFSRQRSHGVMAVIGPFNFPGHLPNGHIVPALLAGNTVVFKPSEKAPLVGQLMAEIFHEAGFPKGVFNLLQGEKEVGRRLCVHEGVNGVLFTGSYEVGLRIRQDTMLQHWKILALEMGGKNPSIVWEDTDLDFAIHETLFSSFVTAGQRCSATSRILVHEKVLDAFVQRFHERSKAFSIGNPLDNPFMGPLVESASVDRYLKFLGIAGREGAELVMRGKALEMNTEGNYVAPSIVLYNSPTLEQSRKSVFQQTELFAPAVAIVPVKDVEDALAQANVTQFGLVASVFTRDRALYERFYDGLDFGLINWNKSTVGASSRLPFGGLKKSGNHAPTALTAMLYCGYPVASLEVAEPKMPSQLSPGLNWK